MNCPGPRRMFLPALPNVPVASAVRWNAAVSNHCSTPGCHGRSVADPVGPVEHSRGQHRRGLNDREGQPRPPVGDAVQLPSAEPALAAEGHLVDPARAERVRHVVVGRPAVVAGVVDVGERHAAVVVRDEVDRLAVGVGREQGKAVHEATLELHVQRVVVERARGLDRAHGPQGGRDLDVGSVHVRVRDADDGRSLILVGLQDELPALRSHVGNLHEVLASELLLDVQVPVHRVGVARVDPEGRPRAAFRRAVRVYLRQRGEAIGQLHIGPARGFRACARRNGGFCPLDDEVPPGP